MAAVYLLKQIFISWMVGHASTLLLRRVIPIDALLKVSFVGNEKLNKLIGVGSCKRVLANSFIRHFNRRLRLSVMKPNVSQLAELRESMTYAETVHLIGFAYVIGKVLMDIVTKQHQSMIIPLVVLNVVVNLYPALVQQMNKRRVNCLISSLRKKYDVGPSE